MFEQQFTTVVLLIQQSRNNAMKSINTELINLYWNVGAYISTQISNSTWGEKTVYELAEFIKNNHPELKGFNRRGLYRMKQFYEIYTAMSFVSSPMTQIQVSDSK